MAKKTYTIAGSRASIRHLLNELGYWHVDPKLYSVEFKTTEDGMKLGVIMTKNNNVVDVATETFINYPHLIQIESKVEARNAKAPASR